MSVDPDNHLAQRSIGHDTGHEFLPLVVEHTPAGRVGGQDCDESDPKPQAPIGSLPSRTANCERTSRRAGPTDQRKGTLRPVVTKSQTRPNDPTILITVVSVASPSHRYCDARRHNSSKSVYGIAPPWCYPPPGGGAAHQPGDQQLGATAGRTRWRRPAPHCHFLSGSAAFRDRLPLQPVPSRELV